MRTFIWIPLLVFWCDVKKAKQRTVQNHTQQENQVLRGGGIQEILMPHSQPIQDIKT